MAAIQELGRGQSSSNRGRGDHYKMVSTPYRNLHNLIKFSDNRIRSSPIFRASYFIAGRITNSNVATELIYSLSNLLCLLNDRILMADLVAKQSSLETPNKDTVRIKMFMTTLEYCEVFLELSGQHLWGRRGRWFMIVILQVIK